MDCVAGVVAVDFVAYERCLLRSSRQRKSRPRALQRGVVGRHLKPLLSSETPLAVIIAGLAEAAPKPAVCGLVELADAWEHLGSLKREMAYRGSGRAAAVSGHTNCDFAGLAEEEASLQIYHLAVATALRLDVFGPCRDAAFAGICTLNPLVCLARQRRRSMVAEDFYADFQIRTSTDSSARTRGETNAKR